MLHVDRNFNMGAIKHKKTETDSEFINTIIKWLYHFTNEIETPAQMNDSYAKLEDFIVDAEDDTELTAALVNYTSIWLRESFKPLLRLLCQCYYQNVPCGDVNANCFRELHSLHVTHYGLTYAECIQTTLFTLVQILIHAWHAWCGKPM